MIATPYNDPFFYDILSLPIPSNRNLPNSMVNPNSMVYRVNESVAVPMTLKETIDYMYGGEWDAKLDENNELGNQSFNGGNYV